MSTVSICVTFMVEEVYEIECEDRDDLINREEEIVQEARDNLLADFNLQEWQGDWGTDLVNDDGLE